MGKSRLVDWMLDVALRQADMSNRGGGSGGSGGGSGGGASGGGSSGGVRCVAGVLLVQCSAENEATPFHAMRPILNRVLNDE